MDKINRKMEYATPTVELIDARVERGFTASQFNVEGDPKQINDYNFGGDKTTLFT